MEAAGEISRQSITEYKGTFHLTQHNYRSVYLSIVECALFVGHIFSMGAPDAEKLRVPTAG